VFYIYTYTNIYIYHITISKWDSYLSEKDKIVDFPEYEDQNQCQTRFSNFLRLVSIKKDESYFLFYFYFFCFEFVYYYLFIWNLFVIILFYSEFKFYFLYLFTIIVILCVVMV
jgi:hypothetical protein